MNNTLFFHIGYPKTGTTTLQSVFFPQIESLHYITWRELEESRLLNFIHESDITFDKNHSEEYLKNIMEETGKSILVSYEGLIGSEFQGGKNTGMIARRLSEINLPKKIILVIRNQIDLIDSIYRQYVKQGGVLYFDNFYAQKMNQLIHFQKSYCDYYRVISFYKKVFGDDNVMVYLYEDFKKDNELWVNKLNQDMFEDSSAEVLFKELRKYGNPGINSFSVKLLRFFNNFTVSWASSSRLIPRRWVNTNSVRDFMEKRFDKRISRKISNDKNFVKKSKFFNEIHNYYCESNKKLKEEFGLNVDKYDYPLKLK